MKIFYNIIASLFYLAVVPFVFYFLNCLFNFGTTGLPGTFLYSISSILILYGLYWSIGAAAAKNSVLSHSSDYNQVEHFLQVAPPERLVKEGIYAYSRNPMYFGYNTALLGYFLFLDSLFLLCVCYPVFIVCELIWTKIESRVLERKFGEEYRQYKQNVPFLVPLSFFYRRNKGRE